MQLHAAGAELAAALRSQSGFAFPFLFLAFFGKSFVSRYTHPVSSSLLEPGISASCTSGERLIPLGPWHALDQGKCPFAEKSGRGPGSEAGTEQHPALEHSESLTPSLLLLGQETLWSLRSSCSRLMPKIIHPKQEGLITRAVNSLISLF